MQNVGIVISLLALAIALAQVADRVRIPYPVLLVLVGIAVGLIPGLPPVELKPDVAFLIFLPPALYAAAWYTSWPEFKAAARPISYLAVGCVLFTTTMIAVLVRYLVPGFGWPEAFVLGAIISPPDAVAATAATKGLGVPRRVITILEGESLVNDATGLIAYRYAVAATVSGNFIFWLAGINFFYVASLGVAVGLAVGFIIYHVHRITPDNAISDTALTLVTPYVAYLLAESLQASGVLAVVVAGLYLSPRSSEVFNSQARIQAYAVWDMIIFVLNGLIFILIGLQLPVVLQNMQSYSAAELLGYGAAVSAATILVRLAWVYPGAYIPRWLGKHTRSPDNDFKSVTIVAWSGMRGIVSLAAALALPLTLREGVAFPQRDMIIFLTFCVIFATLVLQGLTLPKLVRWLGHAPDLRQEESAQRLRLQMASAIIEHIEAEYALSLSPEVLNQIKGRYELRVERIQKENPVRKLTAQQIDEFHRIQMALLGKEREMIAGLRKSRQLTDEVARSMERELDLEEARLQLEWGK
jgi:CPA1 family monovalent cation:H+ antiporter